MPEGFWEPKLPEANGLAVAGGAVPMTTPGVPEIEVPPVGAQMLLQIWPWGGVQLMTKHMNFQDKAKYLVVEVKEVKSAKVVME